MGRAPSTTGTSQKKFRKSSGKTPETLSERFLEFPSRVRLGCPKPYNSRHLRLPEHFQNSLPPSTAGGASFFRSGSGEGLSEPVMEFPAVPRGPNDQKNSISLEIFNLARKFQSRRPEFPTKNRAAVGGSLEIFTLARNFQSRSKSRIFLIFGRSGYWGHF